MSDERIAVTIKLYGLGRQLGHASGLPIARTYPPGTTIGDALRDIGIAHEAEVSVLIGGRVVSAERPLEPGDELLVVPPLVGGAISLSTIVLSEPERPARGQSEEPTACWDAGYGFLAAPLHRAHASLCARCSGACLE